MRLFSCLLLALSSGSLAPAQIATPGPDGDERTRWFREARFGMFVHWGPYAVIGRNEWARHLFQIPQAEYDRYARAFNPVNFDADSWVDLARNAGARYIVITSKHHDGFSIYRSQVSDYDMELTRFDGDPLAMLAESCRRKNMRLGFYHSIMDWHNRDYLPKRAWEVPDPNAGGNLDRYLDFMKGQLRELLTHYGPVAVLWFDGEWEHSTNDMRSDETYEYIRSISPNTLINDRLFKREPGNRGDFGTPEQFVPATGMLDPAGKPILWESCVTINTESWGYNRYETQFKTSRDLIRMLIEVASKGGNLLLNVGPMPDGRIQDEFVTRLNAMGRWMKTNGEAIYGTTASPFARLPFFGRATTSGSTLYLHVFAWPADRRLRIPALKNTVSSAKLLATGEPLAMSRDGDDILLALPAEAPDEAASVVQLVLDGTPAAQPWYAHPDPSGRLELGVESCEIEAKGGVRAKKESFLGHVYLTNWTRAEEIPYWMIELPEAGRYRVEVAYATPRSAQDTEYEIAAGAASITGKVQASGGNLVFRKFHAGELRLAAGRQKLQIKHAAGGGGEAPRLEKIVLTPAAQ